jgi:hypothetical protein
VLAAQLRINDVVRLLTALQTVFDEWKQDPIFFLRIMKKGTDMTLLVQNRASEPNRFAGTQRFRRGLRIILTAIHRSSTDSSGNVRPLAELGITDSCLQGPIISRQMAHRVIQLLRLRTDFTPIA